MSPAIADPYPGIDPGGNTLIPIFGLPPDEADMRVAKLNLDDPQPPGYAYRLPLSAEYDHWAKARDLAVPEEAYLPWMDGVGLDPVNPDQQGISYYEVGLWHHVGGSVECWCGDLSLVRSEFWRVFRGGSQGGWGRDLRYIRGAGRSSFSSPRAFRLKGYRVVRGLKPCP